MYLRCEPATVIITSVLEIEVIKGVNIMYSWQVILYLSLYYDQLN